VQLRLTLPAAGGGNGRPRAIAPWAIRAGPGCVNQGKPPSLCPEASSISHTMWSYMPYSSVSRSSSEPSGSSGWRSFHSLRSLGSNSRHAGESASRVSVNRGRSADSVSTGDTLLSGRYRRCTSSRGRERSAGSGKNRTRNVSWFVEL